MTCTSKGLRFILQCEFFALLNAYEMCRMFLLLLSGVKSWFSFWFQTHYFSITHLTSQNPMNKSQSTHFLHTMQPFSLCILKTISLLHRVYMGRIPLGTLKTWDLSQSRSTTPLASVTSIRRRGFTVAGESLEIQNPTLYAKSVSTSATLSETRGQCCWRAAQPTSHIHCMHVWMLS